MHRPVIKDAIVIAAQAIIGNNSCQIGYNIVPTNKRNQPNRDEYRNCGIVGISQLWYRINAHRCREEEASRGAAAASDAAR